MFKIDENILYVFFSSNVISIVHNGTTKRADTNEIDER